MRAVCIIFIGACIAGCAHRTSRTTPQTSQPHVDSPILYQRTAGIAGTDDRVVIWPDGRVQVHGKLMGDAEVTLPAARVEKLRRIFHESAASGRLWSYQLKVASQPQYPDAYRITIYCAGEMAAASDMTPIMSLGQRFVDAYTEIEAIAADAVNASSSTTPPLP